MSSENNSLSRRKVLATTGGVGSAVVGFGGLANAAAAQEGPDRDDAPEPLTSDQWTNEDGVVTLEGADFDEWEVLVTDQVDRPSAPIRPEQIPDRVGVYVGEYRNAESPGGEPIRRDDRVRRPAPPTYDPDTYFTLADGTFPEFSTPIGDFGGWYWAIKGGVKWNVSALEAQADISAQIGAVTITLWNVTISYGGSDGLCTSISPGKAPIEIGFCLDLELEADQISFGGSVDLCVPQTDPCPVVDCQKCLTGIGLSASADAPW